MKSYQWWKKQKKRVQKKYTLLLGRYLSPKEVKKWYKIRMKARKNNDKHSKEKEMHKDTTR